MITLRRANDRRHEQRRKQEVWRTFHRQAGTDLFADGFATLEFLNEDRHPPGAGVRRWRRHLHDAEVITYVREGALAYEDSTGRSGIIQAGEFHRMATERGVRYSEANASRTGWTQSFQIWLYPAAAGAEIGHEQRRFSTGQRRGELCVVASPDSRRGSLRLRQNALLYSAMLAPGKHVVHELAEGRSAWLHLVKGELTLGDFILGTGDGAGVTAERAVSITAREETEILLLDLGDRSPRSLTNGGAPMNSPTFSAPEAVRSRLRATVATVERDLARLARPITGDEGPPALSALCASVGDLVEQLALGPEPERRDCPVCGQVGMRAATLCSHCWSKLTPPTGREGVAR